MVVQHINLFVSPCSVLDVLAVLQHFLHSLDHDKFLLKVLLVLGPLHLVGDVLENLFDVLKIFGSQLEVDGLDISDGVDFSVVVGHFLIGESSDDVVKSIDCGNVGQESVSKSFSGTGSFDEASDIGDLDLGEHLTLWLVKFAELLESFVWNINLGVIGIDSAEWIVFSWHLHFGHEVESG